MKSVSGYSLYLNDYRICGGKPWAGGETVCVFEISKEKLLKEIEEHANK